MASFVDGLDDEQLENFARNLRFQPQLPTHTANPPNTPTRIESIILFVGATLALLIGSRYHLTITNFSPRSFTEDAYTGIVEIMRNLGRLAIFREEIKVYAYELLSNPETAGQVEMAMRNSQAVVLFVFLFKRSKLFQILKVFYSSSFGWPFFPSLYIKIFYLFY